MPKFEPPEIEILKLDDVDVITASQGGPIVLPGENETPDW